MLQDYSHEMEIESTYLPQFTLFALIISSAQLCRSNWQNWGWSLTTNMVGISQRTYLSWIWLLLEPCSCLRSQYATYFIINNNNIVFLQCVLASGLCCGPLFAICTAFLPNLESRIHKKNFSWIVTHWSVCCRNTLLECPCTTTFIGSTNQKCLMLSTAFEKNEMNAMHASRNCCDLSASIPHVAAWELEWAHLIMF